MAVATYVYPLLNEMIPLTTDGHITITMGGGKNSFTLTKEHGDSLISMTFIVQKNKMANIHEPGIHENKIIFSITQGEIVYDYKADTSGTVDWEGLGIPVGISDYPLIVEFSQPILSINFSLTKLTDDVRDILHSGCRYRTQKYFWTIDEGVPKFTAENMPKLTKLENLYTMVETGDLQGTPKSADMLKFKRMTYPVWVRISGINLLIPKDKQRDMDFWCDVNKFPRLSWNIVTRRGKMTGTSIDQILKKTDDVKKLNLKYKTHIKVTTHQ
jgi:hypothetical protein